MMRTALAIALIALGGCSAVRGPAFFDAADDERPDWLPQAQERYRGIRMPDNGSRAGPPPALRVGPA